MKNFYKSTVLLAAVAALIISVMLLDFYLFHDDPLVFWSTLPILIVVSGLAIGKLLQIRKNEFIYFQQLNDAIDGANRVALVSFPMPMAIIDENGVIVWSNEMFKEQFFDPDEENNNISAITDRPLEVFHSGENSIIYGDRHYTLHARKPHFTPDERSLIGKKAPEVLENVNEITMLYFSDITDYRNLQEEYQLSKPVVMTIMIDRFEDIQKFTKDSEKYRITMEVQEFMERYFTNMDAVLRKISEDRFIVVMEERYLRDMIKDKMAFLDQVREIQVTDRTPVSLSIGIGRGKSLEDNEKDSYDALDMAISRGGDQAVLKEDGGYKFYGTASQNSQQYSRGRIRLHANALKSLVQTSDAVYIMGHSYGDFDSVGSAIGLACAIRKLGIPAVAVVDQEKNASKQLLKLFADYEPYLIASPEEARAKFTDRSVLIIVDTHTIKKLDDVELFDMADKSRMAVIDHHRLSAGAIQNPAIMLQEPNASSAAELVTTIIQFFDVNPVLTPLEAEALLAGITLDTKDFVMRAGAATFEAAAFLKKLGADTVAVKKLFATSIEQKNKKSEIVSSAKMYKKCAVAVVKEDFKDIRIICSQAADDMLYISGVDAAFTLYPIGENAWSISARSFGKINVQVLMESMGNKKDDGGGHQSMAGAQLYDIPLDDAVQKLYDAIDQYYDSLNSQ